MNTYLIGVNLFSTLLFKYSCRSPWFSVIHIHNKINAKSAGEVSFQYLGNFHFFDMCK